MAAPNVKTEVLSGFSQLSVTVVPVVFSGASAGAATATEQNVTVPGVSVGDIVLMVWKGTSQAGLALGNSKVTAANTVAVPFINPTAGAILPTASDTYTFVIASASQSRTGGHQGFDTGPQ